MGAELQAWTYRVRLAKIERRRKAAERDVRAGVPGAAERVEIHKQAKLAFVVKFYPRLI